MPRTTPTFLTLPLELRLEIYTHLLVLPPPPPRETLQVTYRCSYAASPSPSSSQTKTNPKPTLHPQILRASTQIYHEALPILYSQNIFSAHPVHLTAQPTLYHPYCAAPSRRPVTTPLGINFIPDPPTAPAARTTTTTTTPLATTNPNIPLIKKWHLRIRLQPPLPPPSSHVSTHSDSHSPSLTPSPPPRPILSSENSPRARMAAAFSHSAELTLDVWSARPSSSGRVGTVLRYFEEVRGVRRVEIRGTVAGIEEGYVTWLKGRMMMPAGAGGGDGDGFWEEQGEDTPVEEGVRSGE